MLLTFLWKNVVDLLSELEIEASVVIRDGKVFGSSSARPETFLARNGALLRRLFINPAV